MAKIVCLSMQPQLRGNPPRISALSHKNKGIPMSHTPESLSDESDKINLVLSRLSIFLFWGVGGFNAI